MIESRSRLSSCALKAECFGFGVLKIGGADTYEALEGV